MESALQLRQFVVYLQPKYDLENNLPCGAEALVRWNHPQRGMVFPGEFIPVFEHNGFIARLDYYVWEETCRLLRKWLDQGLQPKPLSVNVSRVNMYNPNLVDILQDLVEKYRVPASLLNLELTESAYMDNPTLMKQTLERLHRCGFVVMMDDFGSGYSSLNTLRDISVDILKIDMKFLPTDGADSRSERILVSVIRMAGWLGIPVIMEGVETCRQRDFLKSVGCGYVQGYYYAKPMPVAEYETLVAAGESQRLPQRVTEEKAQHLGEVWGSGFQADLLYRYVRQPIAICEVVGEEIAVVRVNRAFLTRFGHGKSDGGIQSLCGVCGQAEAGSLLKKAIHRTVRDGGETECRYLYRGADGKPVPVRLYLQYVEEVANSHLLIATLADESGRSRMEPADE
ncbi:MAG: EAL domain-containing protein [Oscillospiraceae bacterium]|nr:EAL domain-containing protein [Oscillospiraceae bacterium]